MECKPSFPIFKLVERASHQRLILPRPGSTREPSIHIQRGQERSKRADRKRTDGPHGEIPEGPRFTSNARNRRDRLPQDRRNTFPPCSWREAWLHDRSVGG